MFQFIRQEEGEVSAIFIFEGCSSLYVRRRERCRLYLYLKDVPAYTSGGERGVGYIYI